MDRKRWSVKQWLAVLVCGVTRALGTGAGNIEITFTSPTAATVRLPGGRVAHIVPADF